MKTQSNTQLPLLQKEYGGTQFIAFNERTVEIPQEEGAPLTAYEYDSVRTPIGASYGEIVTAIIRSRYTENDVEAILCNGTDTPEHQAELEAFQAWRKEAKRIAKEVLAQ